MPDLTGDVTTVEGAVAATILAAFVALTQDFRLTLTTLTPVLSADTTGTTIYLTPYKGNRIALYNGTKWVPITSAEVSLALGTLTGSLPYDVFAYSNSGTLTLELLAWTNTTTRATALVRQDGVWCKTGALTRRYVGTIYTFSTTTTAMVFRPATGTTAKCGVFNADNRVVQDFRAIEGEDSWEYSTSTWRPMNNDTTNRIEAVFGLAEESVEVRARGMAQSTNANDRCSAGIAVDATNTNHAQLAGAYTPAASQNVYNEVTYLGNPGVGYHYFQAMEEAGAVGTMTWLGDGGGSGVALQNGIHLRMAA